MKDRLTSTEPFQVSRAVPNSTDEEPDPKLFAYEEFRVWSVKIYDSDPVLRWIPVRNNFVSSKTGNYVTF
jgi:hypothetical protein